MFWFRYRGCDFKALVYEFMVNGSLDEWLHPTPVIGLTNERPMSLNFSQRLNVAVHIAMTLDYLHHHCETTIVHCDLKLKPNNILLNHVMVGHVGHFGLARFIGNGSANQSSSIGVKGTIGYAPPEYGMGHRVWMQGDVCSYGILVLEMFTGKRPTDIKFQGGTNLYNFVKAGLLVPEDLAELMDSVLVQETLGGEIKIEEILITILGIGVACSAELPRERMVMSDATAEMRSIRNKPEANN